MRTRIADLIRDAIDIIEQVDGHDAEVWVLQAKAELTVLTAKAQLREALSALQGPVVVVKSAKVKPAKAKAHKNGKATVSPAPTPLTAA